MERAVQTALSKGQGDDGDDDEEEEEDDEREDDDDDEEILPAKYRSTVGVTWNGVYSGPASICRYTLSVTPPCELRGLQVVEKGEHETGTEGEKGGERGGVKEGSDAHTARLSCFALSPVNVALVSHVSTISLIQVGCSYTGQTTLYYTLYYTVLYTIHCIHYTVSYYITLYHTIHYTTLTYANTLQH